mmetsp:Transcript_8146/g.15469  ORF Transcript_8146/g.15469 Transcript_8146/m.15469 type:complete len:204 (-) Transcript_8146:332-943(-)
MCFSKPLASPCERGRRSACSYISLRDTARRELCADIPSIICSNCTWCTLHSSADTPYFFRTLAGQDSKPSHLSSLMLRRLSQTLAGRGASRTWAAAGPSGAGAGGDGLGREAPSVARAGALSPAPSAPRLGLSGQGGLVPGVSVFSFSCACCWWWSGAIFSSAVALNDEAASVVAGATSPAADSTETTPTKPACEGVVAASGV